MKNILKKYYLLFIAIILLVLAFSFKDTIKAQVQCQLASHGDVNCDNKVNISDLGILLSHFGESVALPTNTPTPIPPTPTRTPTPASGTPTPTQQPIPTGVTRLNMKSYGNHSATYDARILSIRPQYVIDNPPHGLYGEMENPKYTADWLLQDVVGYQAAGIKVIGYITSGYEGKGGDDGYASKWYSQATNEMLIRNMADIDGVDGVFIDEISEQPNAASKAYLKALTDLAHSKGLITWGNTGVDDFSEWFFTDGGFDFMQSSESWRGQSLSSVQQKWGHRISVTGFNRNYTADDAFNLTIDAWNKGIAYAYINTVEYTSIAPWFEEYANRLRQVQDNYTWPPVPNNP